jgi:ABC-type glycerol-3-phosphate transport system substrate-binding protein
MGLGMRFIVVLFGLMAGLSLTACEAQTAAPTSAPTLESIASITPRVVIQVPTPSPTLTVQPPVTVPANIVVWWPEPLAPIDNTVVNDLLAAQIIAFETANGTAQVERRLKRVSDTGGIMSTLRTASAVAPGAMPDLTLIRREDLLTAVQAGLVQPLEGWASSAIVGDLTSLSNSVLQLGQVNGRLYGIPYTLEIQHVVYRVDNGEEPFETWRFDDVLQREMSFAFAAGNASPVNNVFFAQYLAAGGTPPQDGTLTLNTQALREVLRFYEEARAEALLDTNVLSYLSFNDYQPAFINGTLDAIVSNSTNFLQLRAQGYSVSAAPLPTESGQGATVLNGWMWVMTTSNSDRQAAAIQFLNWMMGGDRQGQFARAISMLPSQRSALRSWGSGDETLVNLVSNATLPLAPDDGGTLARAMQNALAAVLRGERTANEATQDVVEQVSG